MAERLKTLSAQDGKCALCGYGLTAGACELDHLVPVRQPFAGSMQILQALCGDCHSKKILRESTQSTSRRAAWFPVSWSTSGVKLPRLVFDADVRKERAVRRRGQAQRAGQRPLPPAHPVSADGVKPVDGVLTWAVLPQEGRRYLRVHLRGSVHSRLWGVSRECWRLPWRPAAPRWRRLGSRARRPAPRR